MPTGPIRPRLIYGSPAVTIFFPAPRNDNMVRPDSVAGGATSMASIRETLYIRDEYIVELSFERVDLDLAQALFLYWNTWGKFGETAALTLNTLAHITPTFEIAQFNNFFTKAQLVSSPFPVSLGRLRHEPMHQASFVWRQQG